MARGGRLRPRSEKTEKFYREERIPFVISILESRPLCERCQAKESTEVHEKLSRGRSGSSQASLVDPENVMALCHDCHHYITFVASEDECIENDWLRKS